MKKKKIKYDNVIIFGLIGLLVLLLLITGILIFGIYKDTFGSKVDGVEIIDTIDVYGYQLTENNTDYYKDLFNELKELLSNEDYSDKEYAELVAKMFVADFYDLNSKLNKNDVGGYQFVYEGYQETFKKFASDVNGVYYYVENNIYGDRKQELPVVKEVKVTSITSTPYAYGSIADTDAYSVTVSITYKKDLGYPKSVDLILIHAHDKIEVVEMK